VTSKDEKKEREKEERKKKKKEENKKAGKDTDEDVETDEEKLTPSEEEDIRMEKQVLDLGQHEYYPDEIWTKDEDGKVTGET